MVRNAITSLVTQLFSSDNLLERMEISRRIFAIDKADTESDAMEEILRNHFFSRVKVCALHPNSKQRRALVRLIKFYEQYYLESAQTYHSKTHNMS